MYNFKIEYNCYVVVNVKVHLKCKALPPIKYEYRCKYLKHHVRNKPIAAFSAYKRVIL